MVLMSETKAEDLHFDVKASSKNPTTTVVETPRSEIIVNDRKGVDNTGNAVKPEEYFLTSLTGCLSRIFHIVAYEMSINIEKLVLTAEGDVNPSKFRGEGSEGRSGFKDIRVSVDIEADADEEEMGRWMDEIEERSQILDSVENQVPVSIELD